MILSRQEFKDFFGEDVKGIVRAMLNNPEDGLYIVVKFGEHKMIPFVVEEITDSSVLMLPILSADKLHTHYKDIWVGI